MLNSLGETSSTTQSRLDDEKVGFSFAYEVLYRSRRQAVIVICVVVVLWIIFEPLGNAHPDICFSVFCFARSKLFVFPVAIWIGFAAPTLGFVFADRVDIMDSSVKLERYSKLPVMGEIPRIRGTTRVEIARKILLNGPNSGVDQTFLNLATVIMISNPENPPRVIAVTSGQSGEGKTTVTLGLGRALSRVGKKVLLVDADIKRQALSKTVVSIAGTESEAGLAEYCLDGGDFNLSILSCGDFGLDVALVGDAEGRQHKVLYSDRLSEFLRFARDEYDLIIVDCPPVLILNEALIISRQADFTLVTVNSHVTKRKQISELLNRFQMSSNQVNGLVLNQMRYSHIYGGYYTGFIDSDPNSSQYEP